jgi:hypothetical protein
VLDGQRERTEEGAEAERKKHGAERIALLYPSGRFEAILAKKEVGRLRITGRGERENLWEGFGHRIKDELSRNRVKSVTEVDLQ